MVEGIKSVLSRLLIYMKVVDGKRKRRERRKKEKREKVKKKFFYILVYKLKNEKKYMTAEKIKGADFTHRIKFVLLVY